MRMLPPGVLGDEMAEVEPPGNVQAGVTLENRSCGGAVGVCHMPCGHGRPCWHSAHSLAPGCPGSLWGCGADVVACGGDTPISCSSSCCNAAPPCSHPWWQTVSPAATSCAGALSGQTNALGAWPVQGWRFLEVMDQGILQEDRVEASQDLACGRILGPFVRKQRQGIMFWVSRCLNDPSPRPLLTWDSPSCPV